MIMNGHFTLDFRYHEQARIWEFVFIYLLLSLFISHDRRRCAEADRDPHNIWDPRILNL